MNFHRVTLQAGGRGAAARLRRWGLLISCSLAAAGLGIAAESVAPAESGVSKEYQVKAAFLFKTLQFVEWPDAAFPEPKTPIGIGILGNDPFGNLLDQVVAGETIRNRGITIQRSKRLEDLIKKNHVLFISKTEKGQIEPILASLGNAPILTVSEIEGFAERGGMVNFFVEGKRVKLEINPEAARRCGLRISSQLLRLARIVGRGANTE
jgi:hypothetical protein